MAGGGTVKRPKPRHKRNKRPNPAFKSSDLTSMLNNTVGTTIVSQALAGTSLEEKMAIGALIPAIVSILRTMPKSELREVADKQRRKPNNEP